MNDLRVRHGVHSRAGGVGGGKEGAGTERDARFNVWKVSLDSLAVPTRRRRPRIVESRAVALGDLPLSNPFWQLTIS